MSAADVPPWMLYMSNAPLPVVTFKTPYIPSPSPILVDHRYVVPNGLTGLQRDIVLRLLALITDEGPDPRPTRESLLYEPRIVMDGNKVVVMKRQVSKPSSVVQQQRDSKPTVIVKQHQKSQPTVVVQHQQQSQPTIVVQSQPTIVVQQRQQSQPTVVVQEQEENVVNGRCDDKKIKAILGMSQEVMDWKRHPFFRKLRVSAENVFKFRHVVKKLITGSFKRLTLLYKASKDSWTAREFHRRCDGRGPTLTLVTTTDRKVCGGYAAVSWWSRAGIGAVIEAEAEAGTGIGTGRGTGRGRGAGRGTGRRAGTATTTTGTAAEPEEKKEKMKEPCFVADPSGQSFVFRITDTAATSPVPTKYAVVAKDKALNCNSAFGPCFGDRDLRCLLDGPRGTMPASRRILAVGSCVQNPDRAEAVCYSVLSAYACPVGVAADMALAQGGWFTAADIEVYKVE